MAKAMKMPMGVEDKKWQAEDDLRTLRRAEEVKTDKVRLKAAQGIAKKEVEALKKINWNTASSEELEKKLNQKK